MLTAMFYPTGKVFKPSPFRTYNLPCQRLVYCTACPLLLEVITHYSCWDFKIICTAYFL